jgi:Phosphate-selective porin O and P
MTFWLRNLGRSLVPTLLVAVASPGSAVAQARTPVVRLTGRVHTQWNSTSVDDELDSEFILRRARVTAVLKVNDLISGVVQPEFGGNSVTLKDAYFKLAFSPSFNVSMGQFKRAFDLFELESSTRNLVIERSGKIRGAGDCAGVGGLCSYSRLTEKLKYSDRDMGVRFNGSVGQSPLSYSVTLTNGEGANKSEVNGSKSFSGRLEYAAMDDLSISADVSVHDYVNEIDPDRSYATAWGVDVEWGSYAPGLHLQAAFVGGQNWKALEADGTPAHFTATQGIVSYRFGVADNPNLSGVEPVFRVSWGDPDRDVTSDSEFVVTTGVLFHLMGRNRIAANLDFWDPSDAASEWSLKLQTYLHF